jgi:hypothetical protein
MQTEPTQFDAGVSSRAKPSARGFASSYRMQKSPRNQSTASMLDEAFAEYSRVDAGKSIDESAAMSGPITWRAATRELIAGISTQLKNLDSQRRQLAQLLESVDTNATV